MRGLFGYHRAHGQPRRSRSRRHHDAPLQGPRLHAPICCAAAFARTARSRTRRWATSRICPTPSSTWCAGRCAAKPSCRPASASRSSPPGRTATPPRCCAPCAGSTSRALLGARPCREADLVDGHDRGPHRGAAHQAGDDALVAHPHPGRGARRGRCRRGRALRAPWTGCSARQDASSKKLAARHLDAGGLALYDLTSSYFEGSRCPLAARGYSRDGKKGKLQVNWGAADRSPRLSGGGLGVRGQHRRSRHPAAAGRQAAAAVRPRAMVLVGDRGMISQRPRSSSCSRTASAGSPR